MGNSYDGQWSYFQLLSGPAVQSSIALLSGVLILWLTYDCAVRSAWLKSKESASFPPGPKGWPLIGNVLSISQSHPWKLFRLWANQFGE